MLSEYNHSNSRDDGKMKSHGWYEKKKKDGSNNYQKYILSMMIIYITIMTATTNAFCDESLALTGMAGYGISKNIRSRLVHDRWRTSFGRLLMRNEAAFLTANKRSSSISSPKRNSIIRNNKRNNKRPEVIRRRNIIRDLVMIRMSVDDNNLEDIYHVKGESNNSTDDRDGIGCTQNITISDSSSINIDYNDLSYRIEKLRLEETNTRRFIKAKPRFLPYDECRKWVKYWNEWETKEDWQSWIDLGEKSNSYVPSRPDEYYTGLGQWRGWDHFLGVTEDDDS